MIRCIVCDELFVKAGKEISCSIKCKIEQGIFKDKKGCWIFKTRGISPHGNIRWHMKIYSVHRQSYLIFKGPIPEGKWIRRECRDLKCVNPDHLFIAEPHSYTRSNV